VSAIQIGRICIKTKGREAGKKCIIIDIIDKSFLLITGPKALSGVKRRRVNLNHVRPLDELLQISKGAEDEEIMRVINDAKNADSKKTSANSNSVT
jgi:large subunit ribosomal protein L14e